MRVEDDCRPSHATTDTTDQRRPASRCRSKHPVFQSQRSMGLCWTARRKFTGGDGYTCWSGGRGALRSPIPSEPGVVVESLRDQLLGTCQVSWYSIRYSPCCSTTLKMAISL